MTSIVLHHPVITEKSIKRTKNNYYTFRVDPSVTKHQIQRAVEEAFSVDVTDVRTINRKGKERRVGKTRRLISRPTRKLAHVKLAPGQTIDVFTTATDVVPTKS